MTSALSLFRLQQTDLAIDKIKQRISMIDSLLNDNTSLSKSKNEMVLSEKDVLSAKVELQTNESVLNAQRIKIEQLESSLYSGVVHSPKELQEIQQDIISSKQFFATLEDRLFQSMQNYEDAQFSYRKISDNLDILSEQTIDQDQNLCTEKKQLQKELAAMTAERNAVAEGIPLIELSKYESLRSARRGIVVSLVSENTCSACGTSLTPALIQSVRHSVESVNCPTCGRILYSG